MKKMSQISRHSRRWKTRKAMSLFCLLLMTVLFASAVLATAEESGSLPVPPAASAPSPPQSETNTPACTPQGEYTVRFRLYELEERLKKRGFARISNSEIVRLGAVKEFDLSLAGAIRVIFWDGSFSYVSRRYVGKIKRVLGI